MLNILIPTDFSDNAQKAVDFAVTIFGADAKYTLVNSYEVPHSGTTMLISIADILEKDSLQLLNDAKTKLVEKYPDMEGLVDVKPVMGPTNVAIKKLALAEGYDMVVMGTKGATGLKQVLVGSVASNTMADMDCPVIAVPQDAPLKVPKKIVFAVDDQGLNEGKVPARLADLARMLDAEVLLLNVIPVGEMAHVGSNKESKAEEIPVFENVRHSIHFIESDDVNKGIVSFIEESGADMLAMVTRKNDFVSKLFGTSNTKQMMMSTHIPLAAFH